MAIMLSFINIFLLLLCIRNIYLDLAIFLFYIVGYILAQLDQIIPKNIEYVSENTDISNIFLFS
jgi:hypothetical protein